MEKTLSKIFIQPDTHEYFAEYLKYAQDNNYNLEIASFAHSHILDSNWQEIQEDHREKLKDFTGIVSLHAPFADLIIHSINKSVRQVARKKFIQSLDIARVLGAKYIIFHATYNPLIKGEGYKEHLLKYQAEFWKEVLEKYDLTIFLENLWEPNPELFRRLLDKVGSERLKVCLDTGHTHIFSKSSFEEWFSVLGNDIAYLHVSDNQGDLDSHLVPGEGSINWEEFAQVIKKHKVFPHLVPEVVGGLEGVNQALEYLKKHKIYPFG